MAVISVLEWSTMMGRLADISFVSGVVKVCSGSLFVSGAATALKGTTEVHTPAIPSSASIRASARVTLDDVDILVVILRCETVLLIDLLPVDMACSALKEHSAMLPYQVLDVRM